MRTNIKLSEHESRITIQCESLKANKEDIKILKADMQKEMHEMKADIIARLERIEDHLIGKK